MPEGEESQEVNTDSRVVTKVKEGMNKVWNEMKTEKNDYVEIRKAMQDRLAWHGGGVYKYYVENMDKITKAMWGEGKDRSFGKKVMETGAKVATRLKGSMLAVGSAAEDLTYNFVTWPVRKLSPFAPFVPKDLFKRGALLSAGIDFGARGVFNAGVKTVGAGFEVGGAVNKGWRAVAEAAVSGPEVGIKMAAKRVDAIVDKIKNPRPPRAAKV